MKALVGAFNQEKALVGAFSVIVETYCETDGSSAALVWTRLAVWRELDGGGGGVAGDIKTSLPRV